jgi:hypothetical protein
MPKGPTLRPLPFARPPVGPDSGMAGGAPYMSFDKSDY